MGSINVKSAAVLEEERLGSLTSQARSERDALLKKCDYMIMPDYPLEDVTLWTAYRRDLRGITDQPGFPENINWPNAPT